MLARTCIVLIACLAMGAEPFVIPKNDQPFVLPKAEESSKPNITSSSEHALINCLSAIVGSLVTGIPLYAGLRRANSEIRNANKKSDIQLDNEAKINTEAEWKRVIQEKHDELIKLRAKDDEQEAKIMELMLKHIDCQKNDARNTIIIENFEARSKNQARRIKSLTTKLLQLDKIVRGIQDAPVSQSNIAIDEDLFDDADGTEAETRHSGRSLRSSAGKGQSGRSSEAGSDRKAEGNDPTSPTSPNHGTG